MYKLSLTILFSFVFGITVFGQDTKLTKAEKAALDSMMQQDEFLKLMKENEKNHIDVSIGIGNGSFSAHNKAVNSTGTVNQTIFTPAVLYRLKMGLSFGVSCYLTDDNGNTDLYQTGLSAAYDYDGDKVKAGVSYTRYISDLEKYNSKSLYQNDIYSYVKRSNGVIQPGLAIGFTSGKYKEINLVKFRRPVIGDTILVKDSTDNKASFFSLSASVGHDFYLYKVFSQNDELDIVPSLILNAGNDKITSTTTNLLYQRIATRSQRKRIAPSDKFQLQSVAAFIEVTYGIGKFFLQPNIYFDYYLPSTTANRLSTFYSVTAGVTF